MQQTTRGQLNLSATCPIQLMIVCALGPNSRDSSAGDLPAWASSIICWRNAGGYGGFDFGIVDSLFGKVEVSTKKGRLQSLSVRLNTMPLKILART